MVKDRKSKEPLNTKAEKLAGKSLVVDQVAAEMMKQGVFVQAWLSHFVIAPPLIITKEEIDNAVSIMDSALSIADKQL